MFFVSCRAFASQKAVVSFDGASLKSEYAADSKTLETLKPKTPLTLSDGVRNGFYRARTAKHTGWISAKQVEISTSTAKDEASPHQNSTFRGFALWHLRFNGITALSGNGGTSYSGQGAWAPGFYFNEHVGILGVLGVSAFKGATSPFAVTDYRLLGEYTLGHFSIALGGGLQNFWTTSGGTGKMFSTDLSYRFGDAKTSGSFELDRVVFGYSSVKFSTSSTQEFTLGLGIGL